MHEDHETATKALAPARRVARSLFASVPALAGAAASLSAVAYVLGWFVADAYYDELGASWIVMELDVRRLLFYAGFPLFILVVTTVLFVAITDTSADLRRLRGAGWIFVGLAAIGTAAWQLQEQVLGPAGQLYLAFGSAAAWLCAASAQLTIVAAEFRGGAQRNQLYALILILLVTFVWAPLLLGRSSAKYRLRDAGQMLTHVTVADSGGSADWRLLGRTGDLFYLIDVRDLAHRQFRVVTSGNIRSIRPAETLRPN